MQALPDNQTNNRLEQARYAWLLVATLFLIDAIAALIFVSAAAESDIRGYFTEEDSIVENLTAFLYFCTFLFALLLIRNRELRNGTSYRWLVALSALGLFGFLDEISFGERLFNFAMPRMGDTKIDALHDVIELGFDQAQRLASDQKQLIVLLLMVGLVLSIVALLRYGGRLWASIVADQYFSLYLVILIFAFLGFFSVMLDAGPLQFRGAMAVEECVELNASFALLTGCLIIYKVGRRAHSP